MTTSALLPASKLIEAQTDAGLIATAPQSVVSANQFVFFAAFDGTNNGADPSTDGSNDLQTTAVNSLFSQVRTNQTNGGNVQAQYYPGPGTLEADTEDPGSAWLPSTVTDWALKSAVNAYNDFAQAAFNWREAGNTGPITSMITSFSRGAGAAGIFAQMLYEKGLVFNGEVLIPPGTVGAVSAALIIDPVVIDEQVNTDFPPGVQNLTIVRADNYDFQRNGSMFINAYTPALNYAVGIGLNGMGYTRPNALVHTELFALFASSNAGNERDLWVGRGWDAANSGACKK